MGQVSHKDLVFSSQQTYNYSENIIPSPYGVGLSIRGGPGYVTCRYSFLFGLPSLLYSDLTKYGGHLLDVVHFIDTRLLTSLNRMLSMA